MSNKKIKKRLALVAVSSLVALLILELFCQLFVNQQDNLRFSQNHNKLISAHERFKPIANAIENDDDCFWKLKNNLRFPDNSYPFKGRISNAEGLREEQSIKTTDKSILFVGDSCTFGYGLSLEEGYVDLVEKNLKTQCINAGVPGYSLFQGHQYLLTKGYALKPKVVVLNFGWNDQFTWDNQSDEDHFQQIPPPSLRWSQLCRWWYQSKTNKTDKKVPRVSETQYKKLIKTIDQECQQRGIQLRMIIWPMKYNVDSSRGKNNRGAWQFITHKTLKKSQQIDLIPALQEAIKKHSVKQLFIDDGHLTALGNQIISKTITQALSNPF